MKRIGLNLLILGALSGAPAFGLNRIPEEPKIEVYDFLAQETEELEIEVSDLPADGQEPEGEEPEDEPGMLTPAKETTKFGPIEFHVVPEIGGGLFLEDNVIEFSKNTGFGMIRFPGLVLPGFNETTTGLQFEFMNAPIGLGIEYSMLSYTRTKIIGASYGGMNVRIARGFSQTGAAFEAEVTIVVGLKVMTIAERITVKLEVELLEDNRPVKALIVLGLQ